MPGRAYALRREIIEAGLPWLTRFLEISLAFHHAVRGEHSELTDLIDRLHTLTDIAAAMGNLPHPPRPTVRRLDGHEPVRERWRALVTTRRAYLNASS
ncbi:hypothetical protein [Streptomyces sp. NPDC001985]|uniref:hypothetical protein n=1 Tax=Streptomyces sp. NPDC001985 TaxID=3154406 RepID=UPI00331F21D2